jgi:hypothetical protein
MLQLMIELDIILNGLPFLAQKCYCFASEDVKCTPNERLGVDGSTSLLYKQLLMSPLDIMYSSLCGAGQGTGP